MKLIKVISIFCVILVSSCTGIKFSGHAEQPVEARKYVMGSDDIPLFTGLALIEDDSSNFDTTQGSIVISKYSGDLKLKNVKEFYLKTLPQMGWKMHTNKDQQISFVRESDKLEIKFNASGKKLFVRFFISSAVK